MYDYIIVGGGTSGCYLTKILKKKNICLINIDKHAPIKYYLLHL